MKTHYTLLFLLFGILFICLSACHPSSNAAESLLQKAEQSMEAHPDTALQLLDSLSASHHELEGEPLARYYLLLTQARDKNYMDLSMDSSIVYAVKYYKNTNDRTRYGKSMYYYGRVMQMRGDDVHAMQIYLDALPALEDAKEYKLLGLLSEDMAVLNRNQSFYLEAIHCSHKAISYYYQAKDTVGVAYAHQTMGNTFFLLQQMDSVRFCINKSLSTLKVNPIRLTIAADKLLGLVCNFEKKYKQAEILLLKVLNEEPDESKKTRHRMALGHLYQRMGSKQNAEKYLEICLKDSDLEIQAQAYYYLAKLSLAESDLKQATILREKSDSLLALSESDRKRDEITQLQTQHIKFKFQKESLLMKSEKKIIIIASLILVLILLIISYYRYKKYCITKQQRDQSQEQLKQEVHEKVLSKEEKSKLEVRLSEMRLQHEHTIHELNEKISALETNTTIELSEKEKQIAQYREKIKLLEKKLSTTDALSAEEIEAIIKKIDNSSENMNELLRQLDAVTLIRLLKEGTIIEEYISPENWSQIFQLVNGLHGDILKYLRATYLHLSGNNMKLISLLILGFSSEELLSAFDYKDKKVLSKIKLRLKERLGLGKKDDLQIFLVKYNDK